MCNTGMGEGGQKRRWTDADLADAVRASRTWKEASTRLGLSYNGKCTSALRATADMLGLNYSHFLFVRALDSCERAEGFEDVEPVHLHVSEFDSNARTQSYRDTQLDRFVLHEARLPPDTPPTLLSPIPTCAFAEPFLVSRFRVSEMWSGGRVRFTHDRLPHPRRLRGLHAA